MSPALQAECLPSEPPGKPKDTLESESEVTQSCPTLCDPMDYSLPDSSSPWDSPGKSTGVGCHFLFQGIFPTQGSNPHLLHWMLDSFTTEPSISCKLLKGVPQVNQARVPGLVRSCGLVSSHQPAPWSGVFSAGLRLRSCRRGLWG